MSSDWLKKIAASKIQTKQEVTNREDLELDRRRRLSALHEEFTSDIYRRVTAAVDEWNRLVSTEHTTTVQGGRAGALLVRLDPSSVEITVHQDAQRIRCQYFIMKGVVGVNSTTRYKFDLRDGEIHITDEAGAAVGRDQIAEMILTPLFTA